MPGAGLRLQLLPGALPAATCPYILSPTPIFIPTDGWSWLRRGSPERPQAVPAAQLWLWVSPSPRTDSQQPYVTAPGPKSQLGAALLGCSGPRGPFPSTAFPIPIRAPQRRSAGELGNPKGHLLGDMPVPKPAKAATCKPPRLAKSSAPRTVRVRAPCWWVLGGRAGSPRRPALMARSPFFPHLKSRRGLPRRAQVSPCQASSSFPVLCCHPACLCVRACSVCPCSGLFIPKGSGSEHDEGERGGSSSRGAAAPALALAPGGDIGRQKWARGRLGHVLPLSSSVPWE